MPSDQDGQNTLNPSILYMSDRLHTLNAKANRVVTLYMKKKPRGENSLEIKGAFQVQSKFNSVDIYFLF